MSIILLLLGVVVALLGYYIYGRWVDRKIIRTDANRATPAVLYTDGVDFLPTSRYVLFGYQFKSIAAVGPIVGPIIALQWGLLPALIWLLLGSLFIGWIQDYTSCILSLRNDGNTISALAEKLVAPRARIILLLFIYFYLLLIIAAFANMIGNLMAEKPNIPFGIIILAISGVLTGFLIYKRKINLIAVSLLGIILALGGIFLGYFLPFGGSKNVWVLFCLLFSYLGAVLPIWAYAQPINYIAFYLVSLALLGGSLGVILLLPNISAPLFTSYYQKIGPLWPLLFVTVACGAVSGWHSLISSSSTSRQISEETDTLYVCGGAMFLEMILAILALIIAASFASFSQYISTLKEIGPAGVFTEGLAKLLGFLLKAEFGEIFAGSIFVILAITVLQLVVRVLRIATVELVGEALPIFRNIHLATLLALVLAYLLIISGSWSYIWVLFGSSNQLLAALALFLVFLWLKKLKKGNKFVVIPMIFLLFTTLVALIYTSGKLFLEAILEVKLLQLIPALVGFIIFFAAIVLIKDCIKAVYSKEKT
jgi:carbon starvation protein